VPFADGVLFRPREGPRACLNIGGIADVTLLDASGAPVGLPQTPVGVEPVWHLFAVTTPERDRLRTHLEQAGIDTIVHYPIPCHLQPAYAHLGYRPGSFPVSERICREIVSLPFGPHLAASAADRVVDEVAVALAAGDRTRVA